jgi:hypothetical protein
MSSALAAPPRAQRGRAMLLTWGTGRRLELQHLLVRHHREPIRPPAGQERPEEAPDTTAPRRHQGAGHGRGTPPAR